MISTAMRLLLFSCQDAKLNSQLPLCWAIDAGTLDSGCVDVDSFWAQCFEPNSHESTHRIEGKRGEDRNRTWATPTSRYRVPRYKTFLRFDPVQPTSQRAMGWKWVDA